MKHEIQEDGKVLYMLDEDDRRGFIQLVFVAFSVVSGAFVLGFALGVLFVKL